MHVQDATFVVVDTETTGGKAGADRIIELGAVRVQGGEVTGRFGQLINPERSIPSRITKITGITSAMVFDQSTAAEVLPRFLEFLGEDVFVAHNLSFDRRFLDAELKRLDRSALSNPALCTLRLARRLLPGLKSKGLSSLADFYDLHISSRHRALGDAEATATILQRLLAKLDFEHRIETLGEVLTFQRKSYQKIRKAPTPLRRIRREVLPDLPERPGVYFMKDRRGAPIYIGKAKNLQRRVRSYFNGVEAHEPRRRKLVAAVREVDWEETPSELDALLLESRLIKEHKPRFNRAGRRYRARPFIRLDTSEKYPRVSWHWNVGEDGAEYYGPLSGRGEAEMVMEILSRFFKLRECDESRFMRGRRCLYADIERCTAPCENGHRAAYAEEVERVRALLSGEGEVLVEELEEKMHAAAEELAYEEAAQYRDWRDRLKRLLQRRRVAAAPVIEHNAVLVRRKGGEQAAAQLFVVRFGRHVETIVLTGEKGLAPSELRERLALCFDPGEEPPPEYSKRAVDEIRLLGQWVHQHQDELTQVRYRPGDGPEAFLDRVMAEVTGPAAVPEGRQRPEAAERVCEADG